MSTAIIRLPGDRREYLAGMLWQTHEKKPSQADLRETAATEGRWVVVRRGMATIQSGYCQPLAQRSPKGLVSLAAMIADNKPEPWLGVFDLGDGRYWCIAVRENNSILLKGDFVGTYDEVEAVREQVAAIGDWTYVSGALEDIANLLTASARTHPALVRDAYANPMTGPAIKIGIAAAAIGGGLWVWHRHEAHERLLRALALARQRAVLAALASQHSTVLLPWAKLPKPSVFLDACGRVIDPLPVSQDGWALAKMTCIIRGKQIAAAALWRASAGSTPAQMPAGTLSYDGQTIAGTPITTPAPASGDNHIDHAQAALRALYASAEPMGIKIQISQPQTKAVLPGAAVVNVANTTPWRTLQVTLRAPVPILEMSEVGSAFDKIPGFRLTGFRAGITGPWVLTGRLYVANAGEDPSTQGRIVAPSVPQPPVSR